MAIFVITKGQKMYSVSLGNAWISQYLRACDILVNSYHSTKGSTIHSDTDSHLHKQQVPN
jgi:hypothetical protein